jgi:DNA processing protein
MEEQYKYWLALSRVPGIGSVNYRLLLKFFPNPRAVWQASAHSLGGIPGLDNTARENLLACRAKADVEEDWRSFLALGMKMIVFTHPAYPRRLLNIYNPPPILFYYGQLSALSEKVIAIVGARRCSAYGRHVAEQMAGDLTAAGFTVVSGMARGIDTAAHKGALQKGCTIAVLGSGADVIYPPENKKLYQEIIHDGAVISEFPPGTPPRAANFPARNRLISGLANAVLVVEAAEKSGALITVDAALEQGRDVYAVPGCITNNYSKGCHKLIQQGAKLVTSVMDILEDYGILEQSTPVTESIVTQLTLDEQTVLSSMSVTPEGFERLMRQTGWDLSRLLSALTGLEIQGLIESVPGKRYKLTDVKGLRR